MGPEVMEEGTENAAEVEEKVQSYGAKSVIITCMLTGPSAFCPEVVRSLWGPLYSLRICRQLTVARG